MTTKTIKQNSQRWKEQGLPGERPFQSEAREAWKANWKPLEPTRRWVRPGGLDYKRIPSKIGENK